MFLTSSSFRPTPTSTSPTSHFCSSHKKSVCLLLHAKKWKKRRYIQQKSWWNIWTPALERHLYIDNIEMQETIFYHCSNLPDEKTESWWNCRSSSPTARWTVDCWPEGYFDLAFGVLLLKRLKAIQNFTHKSWKELSFPRCQKIPRWKEKLMCWTCPAHRGLSSIFLVVYLSAQCPRHKFNIPYLCRSSPCQKYAREDENSGGLDCILCCMCRRSFLHNFKYKEGKTIVFKTIAKCTSSVHILQTFPVWAMVNLCQSNFMLPKYEIRANKPSKHVLILGFGYQWKEPWKQLPSPLFLVYQHFTASILTLFNVPLVICKP